jgi:Na+/H+ antiporter NhaD/arsenite permease-like protein
VCINVVVAANAGGTFSPFGDDITSLMVWQAGWLRFTDFFALFLPALTNWLVPALLMSIHVRGSLMFFYGVLLCVGGLGAYGYLTLASETLYGGSNPTLANVAIGLLSTFVDNVRQQ